MYTNAIRGNLLLINDVTIHCIYSIKTILHCVTVFATAVQCCCVVTKTQVAIVVCMYT